MLARIHFLSSLQHCPDRDRLTVRFERFKASARAKLCDRQVWEDARPLRSCDPTKASSGEVPGCDRRRERSNVPETLAALAAEVLVCWI
jgi:hypothetical protein